jgi:hypothetical protein
VIHAEEGVSDQERRAIMVELKTVPRPAEAAVTGSGFPRNGATKGLENERVAVWDVTWIQGQQIPRRQQVETPLSYSSRVVSFGNLRRVRR